VASATGLQGQYSVGDFGQIGTAVPKIVSGSHYPRQGGQARPVEVWANWFDSAAPSSAHVNVDGVCTPLSLGRGTGANGAWTAVLAQLDGNCHRYNFQFTDGTGQRSTYPDSGSLGIGPASCADWSATGLPGSACDTPAPRVPATSARGTLAAGIALVLVAMTVRRRRSSIDHGSILTQN
jgi:hypothetical protein